MDIVLCESVLFGIAVFGTYDFIVHRWKTDQDEEDNPVQTGILKRSITVDMVAGGAAGFVQSLFWLSWETIVYQSVLVRQRTPFCIRMTLQNMVGYATLFGTYQAIRQGLFFYTIESSLPYHRIHYGDSANVCDTMEHSLPHVGVTFVAGGLAGQIHHVGNHYMGHWISTTLHSPTFSTRNRWPKSLPRLRPTLAAFWPFALCFTAFEHGSYGCEMMFRLVEVAAGIVLDEPSK